LPHTHTQKHNQFDDATYVITMESQQRLDMILQTLATWSSIATTIGTNQTVVSSSSSSSSSSTTRWPFVTLPHFGTWAGSEKRGSTSSSMQQQQQQQQQQPQIPLPFLAMESVTFGVIVSDWQKSIWNGYSKETVAVVIQEGLDDERRRQQQQQQQYPQPPQQQWEDPSKDAALLDRLVPYIWRYDPDTLNTGIISNHDDATNTAFMSSDMSPPKFSEYAVSWQSIPLQPHGINYNDLAASSFQKVYQTMKETLQVSLSELILLEITTSTTTTTIPSGEEEQQQPPLLPRTIVLQPIFESLSLDNGKIVGYFKAILSWNDLLRNIVPPEIRGLQVVVKGINCGAGDTATSGTMDNDNDDDNSRVTLQIEGANATMIQRGDPQDDNNAGGTKKMLLTSSLLLGTTTTTTMVGGEPSTASCAYELTIHGTEEFREMYYDQKPILYPLLGVSIFVLTTLLFLLYDCCVQKRQRKLLDSASRFHAIVDSLFPANVRDRLIRDSTNFGARSLSFNKIVNGEAMPGNKNKKGRSKKNMFANKRHLGVTSTATPTTVASEGDASFGENNRDNNNSNSQGLDIARIMRSKPIADLVSAYYDWKSWTILACWRGGGALSLSNSLCLSC
jgi:hypothetical protein